MEELSYQNFLLEFQIFIIQRMLYLIIFFEKDIMGFIKEISKHHFYIIKWRNPIKSI